MLPEGRKKYYQILNVWLQQWFVKGPIDGLFEVKILRKLPALVLASLSKYFFSGLQSCCFSMRVGDPARLLDLAGNCGVWLIDFKQVCTESNHDWNWLSCFPSRTSSGYTNSFVVLALSFSENSPSVCTLLVSGGLVTIVWQRAPLL